MIFSRDQLLDALIKVNDAIDDALDELPDASPLDAPFVRMKLAALVHLRRNLRSRIAGRDDD